ncbi:MAG: HlyD family secretion protein [Flavobacteriales bacterium]|nr:HlyD family secretion protein [Flavobacteriales bacterium]
MLNISNESIQGRLNSENLTSFQKLAYSKIGHRPARMIWVFLVIITIVAFLPWTQQIRSTGKVTALNPEQRPQTVNTIIPGKIVKWYVQEGDYVEQGDTLVQFTEIKDEYFDPLLLNRTESQIKAKEGSAKSYMDKVQALDGQVDALNRTKRIKLLQTQNYARQTILKMEADSNSWVAARNNREIAEQQLKRNDELYKKGLKSLTELESFRLKAQETKAYEVAAENKYLTSKNEYLNVIAELESLEFQFRDKISKAESDKFTAMSDLFNTENDITKLQNQLSNYTVRTGNYYLLAPQNGYVTQALKAGIGETVKEGDPLLTIMPKDFERAVELFIRPIDLPLVKKGDKVRFIFDGWPAFVFSGWPGMSFGTYGGEIFAIDNFAGPDGMYRVLVKEDPNEPAWPEAIRPGGGAIGYALLGDVRIWFEVWRQINGFPPDFYRNGEKETTEKPKK